MWLEMDFLQRLNANYCPLPVLIYLHTLIMFIFGQECARFPCSIPEKNKNVDLNSDSWVLAHFIGQANRISCLAAENWCSRCIHTYSNPDNLSALALLLCACEHHVCHGCSLKPNCRKLDEKMKLSLRRVAPFCTFGLCHVVSHRVRLAYSSLYVCWCHEIKH